MSTHSQLAQIYKHALSPSFTFGFHKWNTKGEDCVARGEDKPRLYHTRWPHRQNGASLQWGGIPVISRKNTQRKKSLTMLNPLLRDAHLQSWLCVPVWLWCPRCTLSGWGTCLASLGCSGSHWDCGSYAHTRLETHTHTRAHTERKFKNHGCTGKGQRKWKRNRKERNTRTKWEKKISKKHILVTSSHWVSLEIGSKLCTNTAVGPLHFLYCIGIQNCLKNWKAYT